MVEAQLEKKAAGRKKNPSRQFIFRAFSTRHLVRCECGHVWMVRCPGCKQRTSRIELYEHWFHSDEAAQT